MMKFGLIQKSGAGTFHLLPLAVRALTKLERLVDEKMQTLGAQKVAATCIGAAELWKKSGVFVLSLRQSWFIPWQKLRECACSTVWSSTRLLPPPAHVPLFWTWAKSYYQSTLSDVPAPPSGRRQFCPPPPPFGPSSARVAQQQAANCLTFVSNSNLLISCARVNVSVLAGDTSNCVLCQQARLDGMALF